MNVSRHGPWLKLHFSERGRIESAKVLMFTLDKPHLTRLTHEKHKFHIFYQFLAGAQASVQLSPACVIRVLQAS